MPRSPRHPALVIALALLAILVSGLLATGGDPVAHAVSPDIVISQVYGGGGAAPGSTFADDYIELFNRGTSAVSLAGWSVQYASATGPGNFGGADTQITPLPNVMLAPGRYLLVQGASTVNGTPLPVAPDVTDPTPINLSGIGGKVIVARIATSLGCNGGSTPCDAGQLANIVDLVGYGGANFFEGSAAPTLSTTTAALRAAGGCTDTDQNGSDFSAATPSPRNSATAAAVCGAPSPTPSGSPGPSASPTPSPSATPAPTPGALRIHDIQGTAHISPRQGQSVTAVPGIVTALRGNGFYLQDPNPDADPATSEGVFVFTNAAPGVAVGDAALVSGTVSEFRPGCTPDCAAEDSAFDNLTTTQIGAPGLVVAVLSGGNPLPAATVIGAGGLTPPAATIDDDATGSVETSGSFNAAADGIDFYESLEGMRVQINNAVAVSPRLDFGGTVEIPVLADNGAGASLRTARGGVIVRPGDFNPERVILRGAAALLPAVNVGDRFNGAITGVMDYAFGNYKLAVEGGLPALVPGGLAKEATAAPAADQIAVATLNVENLDPGDGARFTQLAALIVNNLRSPDIIGLEEVQDNSGPTDNGVVAADQTYAALIAAVQAAGGPAYQVRQIDPQNNMDGGQPGGNIRVGFLFRGDRGLRFIDRPGGTATTATTVTAGPDGPRLSVSPGRIDPLNPAFTDSRKPLVGEFQVGGETGPKLFVIVNHFNSKGGDDPLFGRFQPPVRVTEAQRGQQAQVVNAFVQSILAAAPTANVIVAGDFNDFEFSAALTTLKGTVLTNLMETQPPAERYSYVFDGNSQALDHILVSHNLVQKFQLQHDVVHVNAEFYDQVSDHDPQVVRIRIAAPVATPTPTSTPTPTPSAKPGASPTPNPTPTATPGVTPTPAPTGTPTPTPSGSPVATPSPKPPPAGTPSATPSPRPTASPKATGAAFGPAGVGAL